MGKFAVGIPLAVLIIPILTPTCAIASAWEDAEVPEDYVDAELAKKAALYVYYTDVCKSNSYADPNITPKIIGEPIELYCFGGSTKARPKYIVTLYIGEGNISTEDLDKAATKELELAKPYLTFGPGRKWSDGSPREVGWETLDDAYYGSVGDRYDLWTIVVKGSKYAGINEGPGPGVHPVLRSRSKLEYIAKRYLSVEEIIGGRYFTSKGFTCGREFITEDGKKVYVQEYIDGHHDSYIHTEDDPFPVYELSESKAPPYNEDYFELWEEIERSDYEPDIYMSGFNKGDK